jgi:uroporphyrinogen-III synthase
MTKAQLMDTLLEMDWVVFTSRRGVEAFTQFVEETECGAMLAEAQIAVVGPATADAAFKLLGRVDLTAEVGTAASLSQTLAYRVKENASPKQLTSRILIAVAENADSALENNLTAAGSECTRLNVYRTVPVNTCRIKQPLSKLRADKILLASPSAVIGLLNQIELDTKVEIFTIGPSTSRAVRIAELAVTAEATNPSLEGLMETMR